jgi:hypothetical protein
MAAERAGILRQYLRSSVSGPSVDFGQVDQFRHVPVVEEILVVGQRIERGAVFGDRFAAQVLRTQAPVAAVASRMIRLPKALAPSTSTARSSPPSPRPR